MLELDGVVAAKMIAKVLVRHGDRLTSDPPGNHLSLTKMDISQPVDKNLLGITLTANI